MITETRSVRPVRCFISSYGTIYFIPQDECLHPVKGIFPSCGTNIFMLRSRLIFFVKRNKQNKYYILFLPNKTRFRVQKVQRFTMTLFGGPF